MAKIPESPGLRDADVASLQWVKEFLSCFGGRIAASKDETSARLEAEGYDSKGALVLISAEESNTTFVLLEPPPVHGMHWNIHVLVCKRAGSLRKRAGSL